jgi:hypothetical protein
MKKITLMASALCLGLSAQAQLFTDDFESYAVGSYLGPQSTNWTTWSGTEGGAEDAQVTDAQASSGSNSFYINGVAGGGPQDVILDFGQQYIDGLFTFSSKFFIPTGNNGYFNIQADAPGIDWTLDCFMEGGALRLNTGAVTFVTGLFTENTWFTVTIKANLTTNIWTAWIDGVMIGSFEKAASTVRSIDYFAIDADYKYFVDDVMFDHEAYVPSNLNAAVADLNMNALLAGQGTAPQMTVKNVGATAITSFDVNLDYNGNVITENVTGVNIAANATEQVSFPAGTLAAGLSIAKAYLTNVNGMADDSQTDDTTQIFISPITPVDGKIVVGEEGTGTWCQWCPRGAVFMDQYSADFDGFWAGIAVHNGDPMAVASYDAGMAFSGYPSAKVDRGAAVDPSAMTADFYNRIQTAPTAVIDLGGNWDPATRILQVSASAEFMASATSAYKMAFVLTEDGITGAGAQYAQSNAYAGGGQGEMGGYENLPNPVPASMMVYDHVARAIAPSFNGYTGVFPANVSAGQTHTVNHHFVIPAEWDVDNMHVLAMLIAPNNTIDNAGYLAFDETVANDYVEGVNAGVSEDLSPKATFNMFPNPATSVVNMNITLPTTSDVNIRLVDLSGKQLATRSYTALSGSLVLPYDVSNLNQGVYMVEIEINGERSTQRLVVE